MPKLPAMRRPEDNPDFAWIMLSDAVHWVAYRTARAAETLEDILADPYWPGDIDEAEWVGHPDDVRAALAAGRLTAWGQRDYASAHEPIPPVHWSTLPVSMFQMSIGYDPYIAIRLNRKDVQKLWPPVQKDVVRAGRPAGFDWVTIRHWAENEPKSQSQNSVTEVLRALCEQHGRAVPSASRMKEKLNEWGWPILAGP